jgi:hypothetical protein
MHELTAHLYHSPCESWTPWVHTGEPHKKKQVKEANKTFGPAMHGCSLDSYLYPLFLHL